MEQVISETVLVTKTGFGLSTEFWAGTIGAVVGGLITLFGQWLFYLWQSRDARKRDKKRKDLLKNMLDNPGKEGWRKLETMAHVIGASDEETCRLLIELDARASETGSGGWALIKNKPLPSAD